MIKHPNIRTVQSILDYDTECKISDGSWVPARAQTTVMSFRSRMKATWLVFTGRADALIWPEQ